jgi:hypothetical protein
MVNLQRAMGCELEPVILEKLLEREQKILLGENKETNLKVSSNFLEKLAQKIDGNNSEIIGASSFVKIKVDQNGRKLVSRDNIDAGKINQLFNTLS